MHWMRSILWHHRRPGDDCFGFGSNYTATAWHHCVDHRLTLVLPAGVRNAYLLCNGVCVGTELTESHISILLHHPLTIQVSQPFVRIGLRHARVVEEVHHTFHCSLTAVYWKQQQHHWMCRKSLTAIRMFPL